MLLNKGDTILTENPTYSGALSGLRPIGVNIVSIAMDNNGIIPEHLEQTLENFTTKFPKFKRPSVLYTVPTGQNPSGVSTSNQRRKQIYQLACKYNLLLLEDDPYWFLRLLPYKGETREELNSYFSMDVERRVMRYDSLSKIVSSGIRVGWVTGPSPLLETLQLTQQVTTLHTSGISQAIVISLLKHWGTEGFDNQVKKVQQYYTDKRDMFLSSANKYLKGLCEWDIPTGGMFVWLKVLGVTDTEELIKLRAFKAGVLLLPGRAFSPNDEPSPYVRASFSIATEDQIDLALKRFSELLKS